MLQKQMIVQTRELRKAAKKHEAAGNTLLAIWMNDSSKHFEELNRKVDKLFIVKDPVETAQYAMNGFKEFAHDWYEWQDEYLATGCGHCQEVNKMAVSFEELYSRLDAVGRGTVHRLAEIEAQDADRCASCSGEDCICCEIYVDRQKWQDPWDLFADHQYWQEVSMSRIECFNCPYSWYDGYWENDEFIVTDKYPSCHHTDDDGLAPCEWEDEDYGE